MPMTDRCRATSLAELTSACNGLSYVSFSDGSKFAYDHVCDMILHLALSEFFNFICTLFFLQVLIVWLFVINSILDPR